MRIHMSTPEGNESIIDWFDFRDRIRAAATPQPAGDGGVKVTEHITVLSFDEDHALTFIVNGTSFTPLDMPPKTTS